MNDPHVVALIYRVEQEDIPSVDYSNAEPLVGWEESKFGLEVQDNKARFEFKVHYATEGEAQETVEDYIRVWEFDANLERGGPAFRLKFDRAEIVDRNPTPGQIRMRGIGNTEVGGSSRLTYVASRYPSPPSDVSLNSDVQTMYQRYMDYRQGHEKLTGMANFCLDFLCKLVAPQYSTKINNGRRSEAANVFQIEKSVLDRIGDLCANKGGPTGARKGNAVATNLTESECRFLEKAVKKMIRRAAEKAHNPNVPLPVISLSDLPQI